MIQDSYKYLHDFLKCFDQNMDSFNFQTLPNDQSAKELNRQFHGFNQKTYEALKGLNQQGAGIYLTVNCTDGEGRKKKNIKAVRAFFIDDDNGNIDLETFPLKPNIVVHTSKNKKHLYFIIDPDDWSFDEWETAEKQLVHQYGGDIAAKDIARIMRLPGFDNTKYDPAWLVTYEILRTEPYSKSDILSILDFEEQNLDAKMIASEPFQLPQTILLGGRNDTLFKYGCSLRAQGVRTSDIKKLLYKANSDNTIEPLPKDEIKTIFESVIQYPEGKKYYLSTDMGNAERFSDEWRNQLLYCHDYKSWLLWIKILWEQDKLNKTTELAKQTVKNILEDAKARNDDKDEKSLKWAYGSQSEGRLNAMTKLSRSILSCRSSIFDQYDMQLNCRNGIYDMDAEKLIPHHYSYYHSKMVEVDYNPEAECPIFMDFLNTIFNGDKDLIDYVQNIFGYLLTGETSEQCMFILLGDGRNGKSTLLNVLIELMGPYHAKANVETFLAKNRISIRSDLARLEGCRIVTASETGDGQFWDEALIKDITGGEKITARKLYQNENEFLPKFKLMVAVNSLPQVKGIDGGIWRRLKVIPFDVIIPKDNVDPNLGKKLKAELPGILNFAIEGLKRWKVEGLNEPEIIKSRSLQYRRDMDKFQHFLDECCEMNSKYYERAQDLYQEYRNWSQSNGLRPLSQTKFCSKLGQKGFDKSRKRISKNSTKQSTVYYGLQLIDEDFDDL